MSARRIKADVGSHITANDVTGPDGKPVDFDELLQFLVDLAKSEGASEDDRTKAKETLESLAKSAGMKGLAAKEALASIDRKESMRARMGLSSLFATRASRSKGVNTFFPTLTPTEARAVLARKAGR